MFGLFSYIRFDQPDAISMATKGGGVRTFYSLGDQFTYLSVQDPCHPPRQGFNERHCISLWNSGGRSKVLVPYQIIPFLSPFSTLLELLPSNEGCGTA